MNQSSGEFSFLPLHFLQTIPPSLPNFLLFLWLILGRFPPCCWQKMTKIWCIFPGESSRADSTYFLCCLKRIMVQQNSTALPLRVNPKLRDASLLLCHALQTEAPIRISCELWGWGNTLHLASACWQGTNHQMLTGSISLFLCHVGISCPVGISSHVKSEPLFILQDWILCVPTASSGLARRKKLSG